MAYSKKPTYSFPDINSTGINKIPQGRIITVDDYSSGKSKMFLTNNLQSLSDSNTIADAIGQGLLIENADKNEVNDLVNTKANWDAVVKLTDDQTINGVKTFTSNISSPNITAMQNNLNTIFSSTSSPVKTQTTSKIITVGSGGDFQDLLSAVNEAKKYTSPVEIKLVSNLQINQSFYLDGINGEHITINFQNYKITNTSSKTVQFLVRLSSIGQFYNLNLENISFTMGLCAKTNLIGNITINNTLTTNWTPLYVVQSSTLCVATNVVLNINDTSSHYLIVSQLGSIISISNNVTINSTKNTGILFGVYNGGIITLPDDTIINKPSSLNLYNTAINTPSANGLILDKTRS